MSRHQSEFVPLPIPDGIEEIGNKRYMADPKGNFTPVEMIKPQALLEDEMVRKIMGYAMALSAQLTRFKGHTVTDLGEFDALLAQEYGLKKGGAKGNRLFMAASHSLYALYVNVQGAV